MTRVEIAEDGFDVEAAIIAAGLDVDPSAVPTMMKTGEITSACERGEGVDAGRHRLTFFRGNRRLRIVVDADGTVIETDRA